MSVIVADGKTIHCHLRRDLWLELEPEPELELELLDDRNASASPSVYELVRTASLPQSWQ